MYRATLYKWNALSRSYSQLVLSAPNPQTALTYRRLVIAIAVKNTDIAHDLSDTVYDHYSALHEELVFKL